MQRVGTSVPRQSPFLESGQESQAGSETWCQDGAPDQDHNDSVPGRVDSNSQLGLPLDHSKGINRGHHETTIRPAAQATSAQHTLVRLQVHRQQTHACRLQSSGLRRADRRPPTHCKCWDRTRATAKLAQGSPHPPCMLTAHLLLI